MAVLLVVPFSNMTLAKDDLENLHMKLASSIQIRLVQSSAESVCGIQVLCLNGIVSNLAFYLNTMYLSFNHLQCTSTKNLGCSSYE